MSQRLTFGRRIAAGFALALLLILGMGLLAYRSTNLIVQSSGWVAHTYRVIALLSDIDGRLTDAESGNRGFALTGSPTFLPALPKAEAELPPLFAELRTELAENPEQLARLDALQAAADARLAFSRQVIEAREKSGLEAAARLVATGEGRRRMDTVRRLLGEMARDEQALLRTRDAAVAAAVRAARSTTIVGVLVAAALILAAGALITRSLTISIGAAIQHLQSSAANLMASSTEQASTAKQQATSTVEVTATVRELLLSSRQIADNTQRVARLAEQTGGAAQSGEGSLRKASEAMTTIRAQVEAIVAHMQDLGKRSQQIVYVVDIINELAEQTNILAINATIEAAGAAEEGRRFGAVAEEIRKLADHVGASTKEIRPLVEEIRAAADTTVKATQQGSAATEAGTREFAGLADNFSQIAGLVVETTESAREIELSTRQQASAVEQVSTAMFDVSRSAGEVEATSRQTVQVAAELAELSRALARIVRRERPEAEGAG